MIVVRCNSHRARERLLREIPNAQAYYISNLSVRDTSKGIYLVSDSDERVLNIKGVTKAKNQTEEDYAKCWS